MSRVARLAIASLVTLVVSSCGGAAHRTESDPHVEQARAAARRFLTDYVTDDGRVMRHDQGDDIVSEGQSYALVLAQVAGDNAVFDRVWKWTAEHLQRPDGLLASHARGDGSLIDSNSATDADVVTAWALLRAGGSEAETHHTDGRRLADAILAQETLTLADGRPVLAAGNWATGTPGTLNPSYWAIPAFMSMARLTSNDQWARLAETSIALLRDQTASGRQLPPDWARVDGPAISATPDPNGQAPDVRYSLDAQRAVVWLAVGGGDAASLASSWASLLGDEQRAAAMALRTDGTVIDGRGHPLPLVAAAAAARASGSSDGCDRLLDQAEKLDAAQSTYYGRAWVALGRALLTTHLLEN